MTLIGIFPKTTLFETDGSITIAGADLKSLADIYGTPLYLYDAATFKQAYSRLEELLNKNYAGKAQVAYASKAYLSFEFAKKLANIGASIDVVSLSELEIALASGFLPERIHLHGNNKSREEVRFAAANRIGSIVIDSADELEFVESICADIKVTQNIWLRINPDIAVNTHKAIQTGHGASKFGIQAANGEAEHVIRKALKSNSLHLTGIHTHLGSQIFDPEDFGQAVIALLDLCKNAGFRPEVICPGGGWGVPYTENNPSNDPAGWITAISEAATDWCNTEGCPLPELVIEPGRFLIARAGVALYRVGSTKQSQTGDWIAAVDGGMADNPRVALYGSKYEAVLVGGDPNRPIVNTRLVGRFCESGDEFIHSITMPRLKRGDLIAIPVSGAYQLSMASNYNLADRPCVLWLENGNVEVLQKREHAAGSDWWLGK